MLLTQESRPLRPHAGWTQDRGTGTSPPGPSREQNVLFTSYGERRVRGYRRVWTPGPWHIDERGRSETGRRGSRQAAVHARLHAPVRRSTAGAQEASPWGASRAPSLATLDGVAVGPQQLCASPLLTPPRVLTSSAAKAECPMSAAVLTLTPEGAFP